MHYIVMGNFAATVIRSLDRSMHAIVSATESISPTLTLLMVVPNGARTPQYQPSSILRQRKREASTAPTHRGRQNLRPIGEAYVNIRSSLPSWVCRTDSLLGAATAQLTRR